MSSTRDKLRAELRADVALMRELGVARWGEIYLGPPPIEPGKIELSPEQQIERQEREREQRHNILFAATNVRPVLPTRVRKVEDVVPHVVNVQRRDRAQRA
jgi:hypothetical protein